MPRSLLIGFLLVGILVVSTPSAQAVSDNHVIVTADQLKWVTGPASLPPGARMAVLEGDPTQPGQFTMRLKLPDGYRIPPHRHPADEHVTVVEGTFLIGMGDRWDRSKAQALPAGGFMMMPKGHHHFAGAEGDTTVQVHGIGPWQIHYLNPADDPRRKAPAKK